LGLPSLSAWHAFLDKELPALETAGWTVDIDDHFNLEFVDADDWYADLDADSENDWFSLGIGIQVEGEAVNLLPVLLQSLAGVDLAQHLQYLRDNPDAKLPIQLDDGRYVTLPNERVLPLLETFVELFDDSTQLDELGRLSLAKSQAGRLAVISGDDWCWSGGDKLRKLAQKIANFSGIKTVKPPKSFKGKLRDYQQQGLNWLQFLREYELGGILADDMGLGKTVQTLAHLCCEKAAGRLQKPSLIIAPTSLVGNWKKEAARFAPKLKVLALQGPERKHQFEAIAEQDLVITTYALLKFDDAVLSQHDYSFLILDEAQNIKNPKSKSSQWVRDCPAEHKLCLTGTPMENHLGELWSLYDFLMPGLLGKSDEFTRLYRTPIEKHGDSEKHALLVKRIAPFLLRRDKQTVATELPKKTEISRCVELTGKQRDLYETIRLSMHKKVQQEIAKKGLGRSHIMILDALLKLRQVCCHPQLLKLDSAKKIQQSNKLEMLMEMLPEMIEEGRRILLFSQFTSMLTLIEKELHKKKIDYVKLTGQTRKRDEVINQFQNHEAPLFLISLKAGGVGLNLTAADTVIHFDPWWNPAVEDQATDRAYRIGQDKPVFVYKLTTENTVEAKILGMQERKRQLAEGTYGKQTQRKTAITEDDLKELFKPL
jgi:SNF2 family DNA or RNA helicase